MKIIRHNMFETNSSSTHSLTLKIKDPNKPWKTEEELIQMDEVEDDYGEYIHREIRSKYAKSCIIYQLFVNYMALEKNRIIEDVAQYYSLEYLDEDYRKEDAFKKSIDKILDLKKLKNFDGNVLNKYHETLKQLNDFDNRLLKIKKCLALENDKKDLRYLKTFMKNMDNDPLDDEGGIGMFFGNDLLDYYNEGVGFLEFKAKLGIDDDILFLQKYLQDDIYFETVEGCMPEDTIKRIS